MKSSLLTLPAVCLVISGCAGGLNSLKALGLGPRGGDVRVTNATRVQICSVTVRDETSGEEQNTRLSTPLEPHSTATVKVPYLGGDLNDPPAQVRQRVAENRSKAVWSVEAHGCTDADLGGPYTGTVVERPVVARVSGIRADLDALETPPVVLD